MASDIQGIYHHQHKVFMVETAKMGILILWHTPLSYIQILWSAHLFIPRFWSVAKVDGFANWPGCEYH